MAASAQDIRVWFGQGVAQGSKRMIVWCDTFDYDDYPEFTDLTGEELRAFTRANDGKSMKSLMEVYDLTMDLEVQMAERRAFHY